MTKFNLSIKMFDMVLIACFMALVILVPFVFAQFQNINQSSPETIDEVIDSCYDLSLEKASQCVLKSTSGFYKYNLDNLGKKLTFDELVSEGGVCSDWSEYYSEIGSGLGYETENVIIPVKGNVYHEFSVWSNHEGYCVLDQTKSHCFPLSVPEEFE